MTTKREILDRQARVIKMVLEGTCTIACAAALYDGECHCRCLGFNHGAAWIDELVAEYVG